MSSKAFSFCITAEKTSLIDAIVSEAVQLTPNASHFIPKWHELCEDGILVECDATPDDVNTLLDDLAIFSTGDMSIKWIITDIAESYISNIASHAFD